MSLKIVFAGTPEFALPSLITLLESEHEVCAVYTKPDKTSGRGLKLTSSPVKQYLLEKNISIPILQPTTLRDLREQQQLASFEADIMVVIAYGLILPKEILSIPRFGAINIHASLLPRWRGASPIQSAILAGDPETGVTIMQIDEGLDTGDMLNKKVCKIHPEDTAQDLHDRLAKLGKDALLETLGDVEKNGLIPVPQNNAEATYAKKIQKEDALVDWHNSAWQLSCQIRAFNPWPIAYTHFQGKVLKIWEAIIIHEKTNQRPGTVVNKTGHSLDIATDDEILRLTKVQLPGGRPMSISDFLNARQEQFVINETILG